MESPLRIVERAALCSNDDIFYIHFAGSVPARESSVKILMKEEPVKVKVCDTSDL